MLSTNKKEQTKWFVMIFVLIVIVSILRGCATTGGSSSASPGESLPNAPKDTEIAATYNGGQVTYDELNKYIDTSLFLDPTQAQNKGQTGFDEYMMRRLVLFKAVGATATDQTKKDADAKVKAQMDSFQTYYAANKSNMDTVLKTTNITTLDIEAFLHTVFNASIEMTGKVTDQQIKDAFDARIKADPDAYTSANIDHILIALKDPTDSTRQKDLRTNEEALKIATDVKDQLTKGGDFSALARKYSDDTGTKDNGGNLGDTLIGGYVAEFKQAAAELPVNTISQPVLSQFGYHIIKVEARTKKTLVDVKETVRNEQTNLLFNNFMSNDFITLNYKSNIPTLAPSVVPSASPAK